VCNYLSVEQDGDAAMTDLTPEIVAFTIGFAVIIAACYLASRIGRRAAIKRRFNSISRG
jgi:hypothetical protein